jgi:ketosteroid isomerase-like protein
MDSGNTGWLDLLSDDVEFWFPKFGRVRGRDGVRRFSAVMARAISSLAHDQASFRVHEAGSVIIVEGTERGTTADGRQWPDGRVSEGRFCNVFEVAGGRITRLFIYLDPDLGSDDHDRVALFTAR